MKVTWSWLLEHIEPYVSFEEVVEGLSVLGFEVEAVQNLYTDWSFVVVQVMSLRPHPQASKLQLCTVTSGRETWEVVCGASNVYVGMKTLFAPVGSFIPSTQKKLEAAVIRGVASPGMLCSYEELGLDPAWWGAGDGIVDLPAQVPLNLSGAQALGIEDSVIDYDVTPNRGDVLSVRGIARELAAAGLGRLKDLVLPQAGSIEPFPQDPRLKEVRDFCPLYSLGILEDVDNTRLLPVKIAHRLTLTGIGLHSPLVDCASYIMVELGVPLHVFHGEDASLDSWEVGLSKEGESFYGLNKQSYQLNAGHPVIRKQGLVAALPSLMGSDASASRRDSKCVWVEAIQLEPKAVMRCGQQTQILTQARFRGERGVDGSIVVPALQAALCLMQEICGGKATRLFCAGAPRHPWPHAIHVDLKKITDLANLDVSCEDFGHMMESLGATCHHQDEENLMVIPPSWRYDLSMDVDFCEEIVRLKGVDNIEPCALSTVNPATLPSWQRKINLLRRFLATHGFIEEVTWSFISKDAAEKSGITIEGNWEDLTLANPLSPLMTTMRPSLLPGLLERASFYRRRKNNIKGLFEVGPFYRGLDYAHQGCSVGIVLFSEKNSGWHDKIKSYDVWDLMSLIEALLKSWGLSDWTVNVNASHELFHPYRQALFGHNTQELGICGQLHPQYEEDYDFEMPVFVAEINLGNLEGISPPQLQGELLGDYPAVLRDIALCVPKDISAGLVTETLKKCAGKNLAEIVLFDRFVDATLLGEENASLAYRLTFQCPYETLSAEQVEEALQSIKNGLSPMGITLR